MNQLAKAVNTKLTGSFNFTWQKSLPVSYEDPSIGTFGGTELRAIVAFDGKLFASNGYWEDTDAGNPALPGAQIFRLDSPGAQWQVDNELAQVLKSGMRKYFAIAGLEPVRFTTDANGQALKQPVDLLVAGVWSRAPGLDAFYRTTSGLWVYIPVPGQESAPVGSQIRSFIVHQDRLTHTDIIFAGATDAIFSGLYDSQKQTIVWNPTAEISGNLAGTLGAKGRVMSFAEANGKLYGSVYGSIYERQDGPSPSWKLVFRDLTFNPKNPSKISGFRGLTAIPNPSGPGEVLLAGLEADPLSIFRIDPHVTDASGMYAGVEDLNVSNFLTQALGTLVTYGIVAYNHMTIYPSSSGLSTNLLVGLHFVTPRASGTFGTGHSDPHAYFLVRDSNGNYALLQINDPSITPVPVLEAVRALTVSPFSSDPAGTLYAGGFDAAYNPVHNTAWLYKGVPVK